MLTELAGLVVVGSLVAVVFGVAKGSATRGVVAVAISLAAAAVGGLVGLLFGLPHSGAAPGGAAAASSRPDGATASDTPRPSYVNSTNLEQVSDWLTKLLLGAGLTQVGRLPRAVSRLSDALGPALGSGSRVFAGSLVVINALVGFFFGFFSARLRLGPAFARVDEELASIATAQAAVKGLPAAPVDPTMLQVDGDVRPADDHAVIGLSKQVERIEGATPGATFTAEDYRRLAQELYRVNQVPEALALLEGAMRYHPDDSSLALYAGAIYAMKLGNYQQAERYYFRALEIDPHSAVAYYNLACSAARRYVRAIGGPDAADPALLDLVRSYLRRAGSLDPEILERSARDRVWDELQLRDALSDLLPPRAG